MLRLVRNDARTVTGHNLRNILMMTDLARVEDLVPDICNYVSYHDTKDSDGWRIAMIDDVMRMKNREMGVTK